MIRDILWMATLIAGPIVLVFALFYAFRKNRRMSVDDRSDWREALDDAYVDTDQDDGPIRVDPERRPKMDMRPPTRASAKLAGSYSTRRWSHG